MSVTWYTLIAIKSINNNTISWYIGLEI